MRTQAAGSGVATSAASVDEGKVGMETPRQTGSLQSTSKNQEKDRQGQQRPGVAEHTSLHESRFGEGPPSESHGGLRGVHAFFWPLWARKE